MAKSIFIETHSSRNARSTSAFSAGTKVVRDATNSSTTSSTHPLASANYALSTSASSAATSPTACNATSPSKESSTRHRASARNAESTPSSTRPSGSANPVKSNCASCVRVWPSARSVSRASSWTNVISARDACSKIANSVRLETGARTAPTKHTWSLRVYARSARLTTASSVPTSPTVSNAIKMAFTFGQKEVGARNAENGSWAWKCRKTGVVPSMKVAINTIMDLFRWLCS